MTPRRPRPLCRPPQMSRRTFRRPHLLRCLQQRQRWIQRSRPLICRHTTPRLPPHTCQLPLPRLTRRPHRLNSPHLSPQVSRLLTRLRSRPRSQPSTQLWTRPPPRLRSRLLCLRPPTSPHSRRLTHRLRIQHRCPPLSRPGLRLLIQRLFLPLSRLSPPARLLPKALLPSQAALQPTIRHKLRLRRRLTPTTVTTGTTGTVGLVKCSCRRKQCLRAMTSSPTSPRIPRLLFRRRTRSRA